MLSLLFLLSLAVSSVDSLRAHLSMADLENVDDLDELTETMNVDDHGELTETLNDELTETLSLPDDEICAGLEKCVVVKKLVGGAQAETVKATLDGEEVVIKIDTKRKMEIEALNYQALAKEDWSSTFLPKFYQLGDLPGSKTDLYRLVIEFLASPTGEPACGWTTLGDVPGDSGGDFVKRSELPFELAGELWTSLLNALLTLKQHGWHHCDFHPYNIMANACTKEFKFIDWERSGSGGQCRGMSDLAKLPQSFSVLFGKKSGNALEFLMYGARNGPESFIEPTFLQYPKVLATAVKVFESTQKDDVFEAAKIQELLDIWAEIKIEEDGPSNGFALCHEGPSVSLPYCCRNACQKMDGTAGAPIARPEWIGDIDKCITDCKAFS